MGNILDRIVLIFIIAFTFFTPAHANVEWDIIKTYKIEGAPLDVEISVDGKWVFILTEQSEILIYSQDGTLNGRIPVENSIDGIMPSPREDILFLSSRKDKTVQIIAFDFIREINITDSPYKGPSDAAVVIAVFSDFQ
jgi:hypothetical protein